RTFSSTRFASKHQQQPPHKDIEHQPQQAFCRQLHLLLYFLVNLLDCPSQHSAHLAAQSPVHCCLCISTIPPPYPDDSSRCSYFAYRGNLAVPISDPTVDPSLLPSSSEFMPIPLQSRICPARHMSSTHHC
ncbi:hypothetical protein M419DRAFT_120546, partial [Trichoderma reesei RUT C-30]